MAVNGNADHTARLLAAAEELCRANLWPVPIVGEQKGPRLTGWPKLRLRAEDVPHYFANGAAATGVGILLGTEPRKIVDVDLDAPKAVMAAALYAGPATDRVKGRAGNPLSHFLFQVTDEAPKTVAHKNPRTNEMIAEVLGEGKQAIMPPSLVHQDNGTVEEVIWYRSGQFGSARLGEVVSWAAEVATIALVVEHWPPSCRHEVRMALGGALARSEWPEEKAIRFIRAVVQLAQPGDHEALAKIAGDTRTAYGRISHSEAVTGLPRLAELCGDDIADAVKKWLGLRNWAAAAVSVSESPHTGDLLSQHFSDYGNAQRVIARHGQDLKYCHDFRKWVIWDGTRWAVDKGDRARDLAQETMKAFGHQAVDAKNEGAMKFAAASLNTARLSNALREAQGALAVEADALDIDPWAMNFLNGTVDLRTGELRVHRREDLITKLVRYRFEPLATAPTFIAMIERALGKAVADWLQKAIGYSITGVTSEKVLFLLLGQSNAGKTTILELFREIFGEYATLILIETLIAKPGHESANGLADLSDLRGARLAITSESEEGHRLREGTLKRLTQGQGHIKSVRKYENPIEFAETHKLWIDTNYRPIVRGTDKAIWNRFVPIPCDIPLPDEEIDRDLPAKLRSEAEGVIAWAVEGARLWHADKAGLGRPTEVNKARDTWRREMDTLGMFLDERCVVVLEKDRADTKVEVKVGRLHTEYCEWAKIRREDDMSLTTFGNRMRERGFDKVKRKHGFVYVGVGLRTTQQELPLPKRCTVAQ